VLGGCNWLTARPSGPSVLFVTIDTLRADHVGAYGAKGAETPTLDALAARGVLFEHAIATAPLTLPSHASLLTGQYPPTHGVRHNGIFMVSDAAETLAERFQASGYATGAVIAAAVLDPWFGLEQGFDHYDAELPKERAGAAGFFERHATQVTDAALAWLGRTDRPFFLWVHYYDPHASYRPPEPFAGRFPGRPYDGEIAYVDHELGRLLAGLEKDGRLAGTVVAVTSDHGEGLGEHGEESHSYFVYDSVLRVPLLVAGPGVPAGRRVAALAPNPGIAATLVGLAGLPPLAKTDVGDLAPLWREPAARGPAFAYAESLAGELDHGWAPIHAIRTDAFHYIRAPRPELFDLAKDPREQQNLLGAAPAREHDAVVRESEAKLAGLLAGAAPFARVEVDAETRARIEALGYVVPTGPSVATGADPKDVQHLGTLGFKVLALLFQRRYAECEQLALEGLRVMPGSARLHDALARLYVETQRLEPALHHAREAARLNPHWADFQAQVAYVHLLRGEFEPSIAAFTRAVELDPEHPGAHIGLMWKLRAGGSLEETARHAELALRQGGDRAAVVERVAEVWEALGEYDRALAVYEDGAKRFADAKQLHMRLAIQYARLGDAKRAEAERTAAGETGQDVNLRNRLGIAFASRRDYALAEPVFRDILRERPEEASTRIFLARLLRETGRAEEAQALLAGLGARALAAPPPAAPSEAIPTGGG
jgi:arylsulfatase A-like enzyme/Flp pilus assembly protein TadD